jgi:SAM-dependent methyltransferase
MARLVITEPQFGPAFAVFEREDARPVSLFAGYRNTIKMAWVHQWWPTQCLLAIWSRARPGSAEALVRELMSSRTLPRPMIDYADALLKLQREFPEFLRLSGRLDDALGCPVMEPVPTQDEIDARTVHYQALASGIRDALDRHGVQLVGSRVLDIGCGTGYLALALAGLGASEVVGLDRDLELASNDPSRAQMAKLLAGDRADAVTIKMGDAHALPFGEHEFDAVVSSTAVEHFADLRAVVAETARVLRPAGIAYHGVEPWFSRRGGHGLCTLDFPWGHTRVTPEEFERYVDLFRPHEAADAVAYFRGGFQTPRLTLDVSRKVFEEAFRIIEWREVPLPARDPHRRLLDATTLDDSRRVYPAVTRRDFLTVAYTVVGQTSR